MLELYGKTTEHLEEWNGFFIHQDALFSFQKLCQRAQEEEIEIALLSSFRSFEDQMRIWNNKVSGLRPVLDDDSKPIDINKLSDKELLFAILRWSALPGLSRHHWGTDLDVYDKKACPPQYQVQLIPQEYENDGIFHRLHGFLQKHLDEFNFFLPYRTDQGGVNREPWHISYRPSSEQLLNELSQDGYAQLLKHSPVLLREVILKNLDEIFERYVLNINN